MLENQKFTDQRCFCATEQVVICAFAKLQTMNEVNEHNTIIEIKNVPAELIKYAILQWIPCWKYAKKTGVGNSTNTFIKAISVWLILKSETSSGCMHNYRTQLAALAVKCKMCVRTLE